MTHDILLERDVFQLKEKGYGELVLEAWSGYPATVRQQASREAPESFKIMCQLEDRRGQPPHRAREWQKSAIRLEKERKEVSKHKG